MSTKVIDRKESKILFLDNMYQLVAHTWQYAPKFPKTTRFIFQQKICNVASNALTSLVCANSIYIKTKQDISKRKEMFDLAIGYCNSLEMLLSIVQLRYKQYVSDYGWGKWGELINEEIKLIKGVIKSDEELSKKLKN